MTYKDSRRGGRRSKLRGKITSNLIFGVTIDPIISYSKGWAEKTQCHRCGVDVYRQNAPKKFSVVAVINDWQGEKIDEVREYRYYCSKETNI